LKISVPQRTKFIQNSYTEPVSVRLLIQESRAAARKPHDATDIVFGLKFANDIDHNDIDHKAKLQSSKNIGALCTTLCLVQPRCTGFQVSILNLTDVGPMMTSLCSNEHRVRYFVLTVNKINCV